MKETSHNSVRASVLIILLAVYLCIICLINFSAVPSFYDADMYCDYRYTMEVWEHKSLFPEGWVFGNQLNAVSTPVLAALIYGLSHNLNLSMAAACVVMAILVVISYDWMLKTVLQKMETRLLSIVLLITLVLYSGQAVHGNQGWTLLFTMCSYYSGYSIAAFLAFGCYLRALSGSVKEFAAAFTIACILSFGTGIQSIRQTAIMVAPLLAVEFLRMIVSIRKWKKNKNPMWIAAGVTFSNLLGLCCVRMMEIHQNEVFGTIMLASPSNLKQASVDCFLMIKDLLKAKLPEDSVVLLLVCILCVGTLILLLKNAKQRGDGRIVALLLLIGASVLIIAAIDIFTTMYVRPRYYFMIYPLICILLACGYDHGSHWIKWCLLTLTVVFACVAGIRNLPEVCTGAIRRNEEPGHKISAYLLDNGYTTIYAEWGLGQDVAVASNGKITLGYWYTEENPFEKVTHLCSLDVYETVPDKCAYLFEGKDDADIGISVAESVGVPLQFLWHDPETDTYLYTAPVNLMQKMS